MQDLLNMNGLIENMNKMQLHITPSEVKKNAITKTPVYIISELVSLSLLH